MIKPSLSTMFWRFKNFSIWPEKNAFRNLIPSSRTLRLDGFDEDFVFFRAPRNSHFILDNIKKLKSQELLIFPKEDIRKSFPVNIVLN